MLRIYTFSVTNSNTIIFFFFAFTENLSFKKKFLMEKYYNKFLLNARSNVHKASIAYLVMCNK